MTLTPLFIDIETRSVVDLKKTGVYRYSCDPSTRILIVSWAIGAGPVQRWYPFRTPAPAGLLAAMADPRFVRVAHKASFERVMLNSPIARSLGLPDTSDVRLWTCTAARAARMGLPRTLGGSCAALGLPVQKDDEGHKLMLKMCKPRRALKADKKRWAAWLAGEHPGPPPPDPSKPLWHETPEQLERLGDYCDVDVEAERAIYNVLPPLTAFETDVWETTEAMNDRGVPVDTKLLGRLLDVIGQATDQINSEMDDRTFGAVQAVTQVGALTRWLTEQGIDDAADGIGKQAVAAMIENPEIDGWVRDVLILRRDGGGSSVSKCGAVLNRISDDGSLRGAMVYCGAASTGRWSSRGAQLHNLPRGGTIKGILSAVRDVLQGATAAEIRLLYGPALVVVTEALRPLFGDRPDLWVARGDYSQIEARVNPWLAGAEWKLNAFRSFDAETGPDLYRIAAAGIYSVPIDAVTKDQRQIGKVGELALGFQGGVGAFQTMARAYGVKVSDGRAEEIKLAWREANPEIVGLWHGLDSAAVACMAGPENTDVVVWTESRRGDPMFRTPLRFRRTRAALALFLPSGNPLFYWTPRLVKTPTPWGEDKWAVRYMAEDSQTKRWRPWTGYGGLWCENAVQATARDIAANAVVSCERLGYRPVLTVHDEVICLMPRSVFPDPKEAADAVESVMRDKPAWCGALPVAADSSAAARYVKG